MVYYFETVLRHVTTCFKHSRNVHRAFSKWLPNKWCLKAQNNLQSQLKKNQDEIYQNWLTLHQHEASHNTQPTWGSTWGKKPVKASRVNFLDSFWRRTITQRFQAQLLQQNMQTPASSPGPRAAQSYLLRRCLGHPPGIHSKHQDQTSGR